MGKDKEEILGNNSVEDVSWLCSLSESELDLLISLKKLAIKRASVIGHVQFAEKFDLKMLRALGFIFMEYLKEKVKDSKLVPDLVESGDFLDCSNLLKRASVIGHVQFAEKFDLKMLRALGFIFMEYLKEKVKDSKLVPDLVESGDFLDCSNLLKRKLDDVMSIEELKEHIEFNSRKDFCKRPRGKDAAVRSSKRPRLEDLKEETESQQQKTNI